MVKQTAYLRSKVLRYRVSQHSNHLSFGTSMVHLIFHHLIEYS